MQNEMIYGPRMDIRKILFRGIYKDTVFYVVSYGSHPCAYVRATVPESFIDYIPCHGGITFHDNAFEQFDVKGEYIGWDYAHCDDYNGASPVIGGKQWTVSEIIEEAKEVIDFVLYAKNFDFDASKLSIE